MSDILDQDIAEKTKKPKRKRFYVLLTVLIYFLVGRTFKIFHWPGGVFMLVTGMALLAAFFVAELFAWNKNKMQLNILFILCFLLDGYYMYSSFEKEDLIYYALPSFVVGFILMLWPVLKEKKDANASNLDA